jgi:ATP-dependent metalloprotease
MVGPPGTGKTLLARALAGEAGVKFYSFSGSEFEEPFAGVGPKRVRKLFAQARANSPCIIFIDEIDALGSRDRNKGKSASDSINQFLVELDGFTGREGIIVIGATNVPQKLDKALIRPGRFDRTVNVNLPLRAERKEILDHYLTKYHLDSDVNTMALARETSGFSGADIENMVNIAILQSINEGRSSVDMALLEKALWTNKMGAEKKSMVISDRVKELTAYHESGHALVALFSQDGPEIRKMTLLPRGDALGFVNFLEKEGSEGSVTKAEIISKIQVAMGGRVSEEVIYGPSGVTGGAMSDFKHATDLAYSMVTKYGMSDLVGTICIKTPADENRGEVAQVYGNPIAIEAETRGIIDTAYSVAKGIIDSHLKELHSLAKALLEYETLDLSEIKLILKGEKLLEKEEKAKAEIEQIENRKKVLVAKRLFWSKFNQLEREQAILKLSTRAREVEEARAKREETLQRDSLQKQRTKE